jgi:uncharacterized protein (DUF1697 family)
MNTYVALLRGINVGGNNKIEMGRLRKVFEKLSFANVSSYINSGNIIFQSDDKDIGNLVQKIEQAIKKEFSLPLRVVVRDSKNIEKLCKAIPADWTNDTDKRTDVLFLWKEYDSKKSIDLIKANPGVDILKYVSGAIVWNLKRKDYTKSSMRKFIGTLIYKNMTARNVNTVRKLGELMK